MEQSPFWPKYKPQLLDLLLKLTKIGYFLPKSLYIVGVYCCILLGIGLNTHFNMPAPEKKLLLRRSQAKRAIPSQRLKKWLKCQFLLFLPFLEVIKSCLLLRKCDNCKVFLPLTSCLTNVLLNCTLWSNLKFVQKNVKVKKYPCWVTVRLPPPCCHIKLGVY